MADRDRSAEPILPSGGAAIHIPERQGVRGGVAGLSAAAERRDTDRRTGSAPNATRRQRGPVYAALDLGTNNCRLLIARPHERSFRVLDGFTRIVRLGEGLSATGRLSEAAMDRTVEALRLCRNKLREHEPTRARLIATEACRSASNGQEFLDRVQSELGLTLEIVDRRTEAELAVTGCADLIDHEVEGALMFDIGGGSSELAWLDFRELGWGDDPAARILEEARVALNPGADFGTQGAGFVRLNLACSPEVLTEAIDRIAELTRR